MRSSNAVLKSKINHKLKVKPPPSLATDTCSRHRDTDGSILLLGFWGPRLWLFSNGNLCNRECCHSCCCSKHPVPSPTAAFFLAVLLEFQVGFLCFCGSCSLGNNEAPASRSRRMMLGRS